MTGEKLKTKYVTIPITEKFCCPRVEKRTKSKRSDINFFTNIGPSNN